MIQANRVDKCFKQAFGSCVLASYSIVANYFTGLPTQSFFSAYCRHYKRDFGDNNHEETYSYHFNSLINQPCQNGYKIVLNLHDTSEEPEFQASRASFSYEFLPDAFVCLQRLETALKNEVALLNLTIGREIISGSIFSPVRQLSCHSVTIFHDGASLVLRDTVLSPGLNVAPISSLVSMFGVRDAVLYRAKRPLVP